MTYSMLLPSLSSAQSSYNPAICYQVHVQDQGWIESNSCDGQIAGSMGQSKRIEAIIIQKQTRDVCRLRYRVHVSDIGWMKWVDGFAVAGTTGESRRMEAIQMRLEGCPEVDLLYQAYVAGIGWQKWVKNGAIAGTVGQSRQMEAIKIKMNNPKPQYDYQGRAYTFFDVDSGDLYLPLLTLSDGATTAHVQTRLKRLYPFVFELESDHSLHCA